jgi:hypothetical protein
VILGHKRAEDGPIVPVVINMELCALPSEVARNLSRTLQSRYTRFNEYVNSQSGKASICGFGPSFLRTWDRLSGDVFACNGATQFLLEKGVVPKYSVMFDADEILAQFAIPHPGITYLVASRCHQAVFDKLEGCNVVVWHVKGDEAIDELLDLHNKPEPMVHGGSAGVTRTWFLAHAMGYREFHVHGADTSYEGEFTHARKSLVEERLLEVWWNGRWYKTTPWLCGQIDDFKLLAPELEKLGVKMVFHGNGLMPDMAKAIGYEVCP